MIDCKRVLDFCLAALALVIIAPLMAVVAVALWLDSPGPIFFSQRRLGRYGKPFDIYKFRKFPADWGTSGPRVTTSGDARMTRVGRFLEKSKLDELPQLFNVLRGDMSFVGPRPEVMAYLHLFQGEYKELLAYKPGIFGPTQVAVRNESRSFPPDCDPERFYETVLFPQKARMALDYFRNAGLADDIWLLIKGGWISFAGLVDFKRIARQYGRILLCDFFAAQAALFVTLLWAADRGLVVSTSYLAAALILFPVAVVLSMMATCCYSPITRYLTFWDLVHVNGLALCAFALALGLLLSVTYGMPRDWRLFFGVIPFLLLISTERTFRVVLGERRRALRKFPARNKVVIYGANDAGYALALLAHQGLYDVDIIGFLDDDIELMGRNLLRHPVLGSERDLATVREVHAISQLWLGSEMDPARLARLREWCERSNVKLVPLSALLPAGYPAGGVSASQNLQGSAYAHAE